MLLKYLYNIEIFKQQVHAVATVYRTLDYLGNKEVICSNNILLKCCEYVLLGIFKPLPPYVGDLLFDDLFLLWIFWVNVFSLIKIDDEIFAIQVPSA